MVTQQGVSGIDHAPYLNQNWDEWANWICTEQRGKIEEGKKQWATETIHEALFPNFPFISQGKCRFSE